MKSLHIAGIVLTIATVGAMTASAHTTEIGSFAECQAAGGEISSIQMMSYPVQTQTRCEINGHVYIEGSNRIIELDSDSSSTTAESDTSIGGSVEGTLPSNSSPGGSGGSHPGANVELQNSNYLEILQQRRAEWQNENRTGTSSEAGATLRDRDRDRLNQDERESFLTTLRERRENVANERAQLRSENRANAALSVNSQTRIENFANGLFEAMDRALIRLENIADRIENKIEEFSAEGHDLSSESEMLAEARLSLEAAGTEVAEANLALEAMLASETPREELEILKTALSEAREALRTTRQELMQVVQSLKLVVSADAEVETETEVEVEN